MKKNKEIKKVPVYLFSKEVPQGEMFSFFGGKESEEYKEMLENGWVDTPAKLNLPKEMNTGITEEMAVNADPQKLISIIEDYGFIVVTPEQMKAEATKMADVAIDIANFSDEDLIEEAERRGLKKAEEPEDNEVEQGEAVSLMDKFQEAPESLEIDDLLDLGKELNLGLRSNWSKEVMIEKINAKLSEG